MPRERVARLKARPQPGEPQRNMRHRLSFGASDFGAVRGAELLPRPGRQSSRQAEWLTESHCACRSKFQNRCDEIFVRVLIRGTISLRLIVPPGLILPPHSGQTPEPTPYPPTPPPGIPYPLGGRTTAYPPYCTLASRPTRPECRPSLQGDLRRLHEAGSSGSAATHPYDTPLPATTTPLSRVAVA